MKRWGTWVVQELGLKGFVFDAVKHFSQFFLSELCTHLNSGLGQDLFFVGSSTFHRIYANLSGEYWSYDLNRLKNYILRMPMKFALFDCPLLCNFSRASRTLGFDMRRIFDNTLVHAMPVNAITLVQNHDTQPGQALFIPIEDYFKPLAYALILLRRDGHPVVFYGDLYGINGPNGFIKSSCGGQLAKLILARNLYAYGTEVSYIDHPMCIGWVRMGVWDRPDGCAVIMSTGNSGEKWMSVGRRHAGEIWSDLVQTCDFGS